MGPVMSRSPLARKTGTSIASISGLIEPGTIDVAAASGGGGAAMARTASATSRGSLLEWNITGRCGGGYVADVVSTGPLG